MTKHIFALPQPDLGLPKGPPYPPTTAGLGGKPTLGLDVPVTAVFLALFIGGAVVNMAILQINRKRDHKFLFSGVMFGFCMARITTCIMRIVWATRLSNARIAIAAQIFVFAGVILIFIINIVLALRLLRALHPDIGWKRMISLLFYVYIFSIILVLAALITCTVQSFYTLSHNTRRIDHDVQLFGATYYAVAAFLPTPIVLISWLTHHRSKADHFGSGSVNGKIMLLLFTSTLLTLGAAFRAGTNFYSRPANHPAWHAHGPENINKTMAANPPARRVITGHTPDGKATIISDVTLTPVSPADPTNLSHQAENGGFINLWRTDGFPANVNGTPKESHGAAVPISDSTDTIIRIVDLAPGVSVPMHRTISNDVVHVTKGELTLELDDGVETVLKAGDTCVQRGTEAVVEGKRLATVDI
ncbi:hypothetical protein B7463_g9247, partial [Scytalidium lignicola]